MDVDKDGKLTIEDIKVWISRFMND
jgi:hypothetical protein